MTTISSVVSGYASACLSRTASTGQSLQAGRQEEDNPLKKLFASIDSDGDGSLSGSELSAALSSQEQDAQIDIDGLLGLLDQDGGGSVSESEFAQALAPPPPPPPEEGQAPDLQSLLSGLDTDGDGLSGQEELAAASDSDQASELIALLDLDGDGSLGLEELAEGLRAERAPPPPPEDATADSGTQDDATRQAYASLLQLAIDQYRNTGSSAYAVGSTGSQLDLAA